MIHFFVEKILELVGDMGYTGIFLMMTIEASFLPFPSELILIPAGSLISSGEINFFILVVSATLGSLAGSSFNYILGYYLGAPLVKKILEKYGKYVFLNINHYEKSESFFLRHGEISTFIGRFLPGVRSLISFPPGICKMNFYKFGFYTLFASFIANSLLVGIGYVAGENKDLIDTYLKEAFLLTILLIVGILSIYVLKQKSRKK